MRWIVALFATSVLLSGCDGFSPMTGNSNNQSSSRPRPPDKSEPPLPQPQNICYPGEDHEYHTCIEPTRSHEVSSPDHQYPDPFSQARFPNGQNPNQYLQPINFLDLEALNPRLALTSHFQIVELMSAEKGRYGLFSVPALQKIEQIRSAIAQQMIVTSGYRSPGYNAAIPGASRWSRHTYGDAIDFVSPGLSLAELKTQCESVGASFVQVYERHIHCDWRNLPLDQNFYPDSEVQPDRVDVSSTLASLSTIVVKTTKSQVALNVEHPPAEDGGRLIYHWKITSPSGIAKDYYTSIVRLERKESGLHHIELTVGGTVHLQGLYRW